MIKASLRHCYWLLKHKFYVFKFGWYFRVPLFQLIIHDWDKFGWNSFHLYTLAYFAGIDTGKFKDVPGFKEVQDLHTKKNPHHWQHWVTFYGLPKPIPEKYLRELLADWFATGIFWQQEIWTPREPYDYYLFHKDDMILHPSARSFIEQELLKVAVTYQTTGKMK